MSASTPQPPAAMPRCSPEKSNDQHRVFPLTLGRQRPSFSFMFPLSDQNPSGRTPYVTYGLMAVNILAFIWYSIAYPDGLPLLQFYGAYAVIPVEITNGGGYGTLLSFMFIHVGILHLAGNILFLWIFGDNIEDEMGHLLYLLFYLASGVASALVQVAADPYSRVPTVGASGAIAGIMGAYILLYPRAKIDILVFLIVYFRVISVPAVWVLGIWLAIQFFGGFATETSEAGVAYWAHAGGFIAGAILCIPLWLWRGGPKYWAKPEEDATQADTAGTPRSVSRLPKIKHRHRTPPNSSPWGK